jgi:hypothetical protein
LTFQVDKSKMLSTHTQQLFIEQADRKEEAVYTVRDEDYTPGSLVSGKAEGRVYPSLYRLYMEACDLGEFDFANKYLLSYDHWLRLCEAGFFRPLIKKWRRDLRAKLRSEAYRNIILESLDPKNKNYYNANRYLESLEKEETKKGKGRPTKEVDITSHDAFSRMRLNEDVSRILNPKDIQ